MHEVTYIVGSVVLAFSLYIIYKKLEQMEKERLYVPPSNKRRNSRERRNFGEIDGKDNLKQENEMQIDEKGVYPWQHNDSSTDYPSDQFGTYNGTDNGPNLFMPTERSPARNTYWRNANWLEDNYLRRSPTPYQLTPNGNEPRYYYEGGRNRHHGSAQKYRMEFLRIPLTQSVVFSSENESVNNRYQYEEASGPIQSNQFNGAMSIEERSYRNAQSSKLSKKQNDSAMEFEEGGVSQELLEPVMKKRKSVAPRRQEDSINGLEPRRKVIKVSNSSEIEIKVPLEKKKSKRKYSKDLSFGVGSPSAMSDLETKPTKTTKNATTYKEIFPKKRFPAITGSTLVPKIARSNLRLYLTKANIRERAAVWASKNPTAPTTATTTSPTINTATATKPSGSALLGNLDLKPSARSEPHTGGALFSNISSAADKLQPKAPSPKQQPATTKLSENNITNILEKTIKESAAEEQKKATDKPAAPADNKNDKSLPDIPEIGGLTRQISKTPGTAEATKTDDQDASLLDLRRQPSMLGMPSRSTSVMPTLAASEGQETLTNANKASLFNNITGGLTQEQPKSQPQPQEKADGQPQQQQKSEPVKSGLFANLVAETKPSSDALQQGTSGGLTLNQEKKPQEDDSKAPSTSLLGGLFSNNNPPSQPTDTASKLSLPSGVGGGLFGNLISIGASKESSTTTTNPTTTTTAPATGMFSNLGSLGAPSGDKSQTTPKPSASLTQTQLTDEVKAAKADVPFGSIPVSSGGGNKPDVVLSPLPIHGKDARTSSPKPQSNAAADSSQGQKKELPAGAGGLFANLTQAGGVDMFKTVRPGQQPTSLLGGLFGNTQTKTGGETENKPSQSDANAGAKPTETPSSNPGSLFTGLLAATTGTGTGNVGGSLFGNLSSITPDASKTGKEGGTGLLGGLFNNATR